MLSPMSDLTKLLDPTVRPTVVNDVTGLVDRTIASQSGLTGMAIKSATSAARKADADIVSKVINRSLPDIVDALTPYWDAYDAEQSAGFGNYLASRQDDVVADVLGLGDKYVQQAPAAAQKVYSSLRGKAGKIIAPALPEFGEIIERHAL
ncbi:hypothetical protein SAMN04488535_1622 [Corynebacterium mycetoides]|uniref:Uncharacterized protein n=2 Tax=Corynebacterium mycetoides TaxID=38302 RepID=A0A1G9PX21_9CORY|nr:hypothetical protein SAMN04488535_1622 [Corynebacterium mycetoides]